MQKSKKTSSLVLRLRIEQFLTEQLWQLALVLSFVAFCGWLFNKPFESIMFCISHTVIRHYFEKQYHCAFTGLCLSVTCTIAFFGILTVLPLTLSLLSVVPVCFFIAWLGYVVQDRIDLITLNNKLKQRPELTDRELFIKQCKDLRYNDLKTQIAVRLFVDKQGIKEVWNWLCETQYNPPEYDSVKRMKYRIQKDLFKK